jgi:NADPH-dependent 2,4-dienoyl-CoA reductase/sulfur reductase-like enzyme
MVAAMHRDHGVDLRTGVVVSDVIGKSRVTGVALSDGSRIGANVEHWTNAVEQGVHAAENALAGPGASTSFSSVPYFWSDQYDRKVQFIGLARRHDETVVVDGSVADRGLRRFSGAAIVWWRVSP